MAVYYNFFYIDLEIEKSIPIDDDGFYSYDTCDSFEDVNNPTIFKTMNNQFARDCFNAFLNNFSSEFGQIDELKKVFGNMFWFENFKKENEGISFFFNYWKLQWDGLYIDCFSIHQKDIVEILKFLSIINLNKYFEIVKNRILTTEAENIRHQTIVKEWIKMFEIAVAKNKGIGFNIG